MTQIQHLPAKQPNESWYLDFDFTNALTSSANPESGESLSSIDEVSVVNEDTGEDVTATMADAFNDRVTGTHAYVWITGGEDGAMYRVTCRVNAALSQQVFELDCYLPVRET